MKKKNLRFSVRCKLFAPKFVAVAVVVVVVVVIQFLDLTLYKPKNIILS